MQIYINKIGKNIDMIKTVLIVDNSSSVINLLAQEITKALNVRILKTTNFKEALQYILKEDIIHIAILDLNLSDIKNGKLIDYAIHKGIPSVILTTTLDKKSKELFLKKILLIILLKIYLKVIKI